MRNRRSSHILSDLFLDEKVDKIKEKSRSKEYDHIGGLEDTYMIYTTSGQYELHRKIFIDSLNELKSSADKPILHLSSQTKETLDSVSEVLRLVQNTKLYKILLEDVKKIFAEVKNIVPGTVSAFFIGCLRSNIFPGQPGCDPRCTSSLSGDKEGNSCEDLVLIYQKGIFNALNEKTSEHAYIYIEDSGFKGFSNINYQQLKDANIQKVTLIIADNNKIKQVQEKIPINQLQSKLDLTGIVMTKDNNGNYLWIWILMLIFILLICVAAYYWYK